jgi:hypothetical protein
MGEGFSIREKAKAFTNDQANAFMRQVLVLATFEGFVP